MSEAFDQAVDNAHAGGAHGEGAADLASLATAEDFDAAMEGFVEKWG